jgi:xanthine/uracil permease
MVTGSVVAVIGLNLASIPMKTWRPATPTRGCSWSRLVGIGAGDGAAWCSGC